MTTASPVTNTTSVLPVSMKKIRNKPTAVKARRAPPYKGLNTSQAVPSTRHAIVPPTIKANIPAARAKTIPRRDPTRGIQDKSTIMGANKQ